MRRIVQCCFKRALPLMLCAAITLGGVAAQSPIAGSPPKPAAALVSANEAVRYLEQSTFGPSRQLINRVQSAGIKDVLQDEFSVPISYYQTLPVFPSDSSIGCPTGSDPNCFRDNYTMYPLQVRFFLNALYGDDQLRQPTFCANECCRCRGRSH